jgi:lysophospholipase L1-like esterase
MSHRTLTAAAFAAVVLGAAVLAAQQPRRGARPVAGGLWVGTWDHLHPNDAGYRAMGEAAVAPLEPR